MAPSCNYFRAEGLYPPPLPASSLTRRRRALHDVKSNPITGHCVALTPARFVKNSPTTRYLLPSRTECPRVLSDLAFTMLANCVRQRDLASAVWARCPVQPAGLVAFVSRGALSSSEHEDDSDDDCCSGYRKDHDQWPVEQATGHAEGDGLA
jgi:hypothetical protein